MLCTAVNDHLLRYTSSLTTWIALHDTHIQTDNNVDFIIVIHITQLDAGLKITSCSITTLNCRWWQGFQDNLRWFEVTISSTSFWSNEPFWIYFTLFTIGCLSMFLRTHKLRKVFKRFSKKLRLNGWAQFCLQHPPPTSMLPNHSSGSSIIKVYLKTILSFYENMKRIPSSVIQKFTPEQKSTSTFGRFEDDVYYIQSYFDDYFDNIFQ